MELAGTVIYFLLISGMGAAMLRRFKIDAVLILPASMVAGSIAAGLYMLALAHLGLIYPVYIWAFLAAAFGLSVFSHKRLLEGIRRSASFIRDYLLKKDRWTLPFIAALSALILWLVLLTFLPPREPDAMRYHLVQLRDMVENHAFIFRPYYHFNFPIYFSLVFLPVFMLFKGVGMQAAVLVYFLMSGFTLLLIARRVGLRHSRFLTLFLFLTPAIYHEAHIVMNDLVTVFYLLTAVILMIESGGVGILFFLSAASLGFALGVKYQAVLFLPWFSLLAWKSMDKDPAGRIKYVILAFAFMAAVAAPFYIRNYINTGDPIWPLAQDLFNVRKDYLYEVTNSISREMKGEYSLDALMRSLGGIVLDPRVPVSVWVFAFLGAALKMRAGLYSGLGLASFFILWWLNQPDMYARFSIFVLPLALIPAVMLYEALTEKKLMLIRSAYVVLAGVTLSYGVILGYVYSRGYLRYYIDHDLKRYHATTWYYREFDWINTNLAKDARVLDIIYASQSYYLDREVYNADPWFSGLIDWTSIKDASELRSELEGMHIDYVLYEDRDWSMFPGGRRMTELVRDLYSSPHSKVIWKRKTLVSDSRTLETFYPTDVVLFKLNRPGL